jgi:hypothetical protein
MPGDGVSPSKAPLRWQPRGGIHTKNASPANLTLLYHIITWQNFFSDPPVIPSGYRSTEVVCLKRKIPGGGDFSRAVKYRNWEVERTKKQSVLHTMALPFI